MVNLVVGKIGRSNVYACPAEGGFRVGRMPVVPSSRFYGSMSKGRARQYRKAAYRAGCVDLAKAVRMPVV